MKPFQLVHVNVWGPYKVPTHNKCHFFLTLVDDYFRITWVHFIKHKSDAVQILQDFIAYVKVQFHSMVMTIRCDNAKELTEGEI